MNFFSSPLVDIDGELTRHSSRPPIHRLTSRLKHRTVWLITYSCLLRQSNPFWLVQPKHPLSQLFTAAVAQEDFCRMCYITCVPLIDEQKSTYQLFHFFICFMITCWRAACGGQYLAHSCSCERLTCSDLCHINPSYTLSALCVSVFPH